MAAAGGAIQTGHTGGAQFVIQEAIAKIQQLADEARQPHVLKPAQEPGHVYYLVEGDEAHLKFAEPPPRDHRVADLPTLAELCLRFASDERPVALWYGKGGVEAIFDDDEGRRDRARLALTPSRQMAVLSQWASELKWLEQTHLVRVLRAVFPHAFASAGVVDVFRRLKFRQASSGEKVVEHGRASLGKSIEAELTGASSVPEELQFHVPAFCEGGFRIMCLIPCVVEIDPAAERIAIMPTAGALDAAWDDVEQELGARVLAAVEGAEHVHVYRGAP